MTAALIHTAATDAAMTRRVMLVDPLRFAHLALVATAMGDIDIRNLPRKAPPAEPTPAPEPAILSRQQRRHRERLAAKKVRA